MASNVKISKEARTAVADLERKGLLTSAAAMALLLIRKELKSAKGREKVKAVALEIYNVIGTAYADDPDFQQL